ncbi:O-GlcNAcase NagJ [Geobacter sp. OR-1]|uniref:beta-N-acetylglucosaminidase domain-containing protein n=1 Tax=Geobacter sp. OR-1 TaxID=1266765 RepID=UPI000541DECE|nr:beta-N-acetylglucosaminidase domain-containing protein [Geobacter sp. OR-1]GAM10727.1 O-GlcNAcase NagJ [Geobacter sp. OR-1]
MKTFLVFIEVCCILFGSYLLAAGEVIPKPWQARYGANLGPLGRVTILTQKGIDATTKKRLLELIQGMTSEEILQYDLKSNASATKTLIMLGSPTDSKIERYINMLNLNRDWSQLGSQGYLLYAGEVKNKIIILMVANTEVGRYYALQSLKQLHVTNGNEFYFRAATIVDRPLYETRGIVFGDFKRWFNGPPVIHDRKTIYTGWPYRERAQQLKFNFVWLAGWDDARKRSTLPFNDSDKKNLKAFFEDCSKNFITPSVGLRPYRQFPFPGREKGGVMYSSQQDVEGVTRNLLTLYSIGFRNLYLAFDDIPPDSYFLYDQDKAMFKHLGEAHYHFISRVYSKLKKVAPDIVFRIIPTEYSGVHNLTEGGKAYLKSVSMLPKEIEFVWSGRTYRDPVADSKEAQDFSHVSGDRKIIVWSNYYPGKYYPKAAGQTPIPKIVAPFKGGDENLFRFTSGFFFLPVDQPNEDGAHVSWYTTSDYMWRPSDYSPDDSFNRALKYTAK